MSGAAEAKKVKGKKKKRGKGGPYGMLLKEFEFAFNELLVVSEVSTEEGKNEAVLLTCLYLVEFVKRFRSPEMTRDRCRDLSLTALHMQRRRQAPSELEALLNEGGSDVRTDKGNLEGSPKERPSVQGAPSGGPPPNTGKVPSEVEHGTGQGNSEPVGPRPSEAPLGDPVSPSGEGSLPDVPPPERGESAGPTAGEGAGRAGLTILPVDEGPGRGDEKMNDWAKANLGPQRKIVLPDGTERVVEDLQLPDVLAEKELPSGVRGGAFGHVPTDMRMFSCPGCKMDLLAIQQRCNACGWAKPK